MLVKKLLCFQKPRKTSTTSDVETGSDAKPGTNLVLFPSLNFFFYFGFVPFKTEVTSGGYRWKTFRVQKIFCIVTSMSSVFVATRAFHGCVTYLASNQEDIVAVFEAVNNASSLLNCVVLLNILWRRRPQLMEVLEYTQMDRVKHPKIIHGMVYFIYALQVVSFIPVTFKMFTEANHYAYIDFLGTQPNSTEANVAISPPLEWRKLYYFGKLFFFMYVCNIYTLTQVLFMGVTITVLQMGREFKRNMAKITSQENIKPGLELYHRLRKTSNALRDLFGDFLLPLYISNVAYYAEAPHLLQGLRGSGEKMIFIYFLFMSVFWIMAAEFHYEVQGALQKWLEFCSGSDELSITDRLRLLTISGELSTDPIALSSKYFPVTYSHLSSMLGLTVTYAIIVFQMRSRGPSTSSTVDFAVFMEN